MLSKHSCLASLVSPVVTVSKLTLPVRTATRSQPKNICFGWVGIRVVAVDVSVVVAELEMDVVSVEDADVVNVDVWVEVPVEVAVEVGQVLHLAGHLTATGTLFDPSVRTREHGRSEPSRQSSGSGTPLHSSLVLVVVAEVVAVVVSELEAVVVSVLDAVDVGDVDAVLVKDED